MDSLRRTSIVPRTAGLPSAVVVGVHSSPMWRSAAHANRCAWHERRYTRGRIARRSSIGTATSCRGTAVDRRRGRRPAARRGWGAAGLRRAAADGVTLVDPDVERDTGPELRRVLVRLLAAEPVPLQAEVGELHRGRRAVGRLHADQPGVLVLAILLEGGRQPGDRLGLGARRRPSWSWSWRPSWSWSEWRHRGRPVRTRRRAGRRRRRSARRRAGASRSRPVACRRPGAVGTTGPCPARRTPPSSTSSRLRFLEVSWNTQPTVIARLEAPQLAARAGDGDGQREPGDDAVEAGGGGDERRRRQPPRRRTRTLSARTASVCSSNSGARRRVVVTSPSTTIGDCARGASARSPGDRRPRSDRRGGGRRRRRGPR